jgi:protein gp37
MSDLFHAGVEFGFIDLVFEVMDSCRRHTFQVLTKRPEVAVQYFESRLVAAPPNVWLGISAEDQKTFSKRWALLSEIDARTRFVSYEPALGPIGLFPADVQGAPIQLAIPCQRCEGSMSVKAPGGGKPCPDCFNSQAGQGWWPAPNWIIAGSESGRGARPAQVSWFYNLLLEGRMVRAAFFMKQIDDGRGKLLPYDAFPEELQVREFPTR